MNYEPAWLVSSEQATPKITNTKGTCQPKVGRCCDCGLILARQTAHKRCVTCSAMRKLQRQNHRRAEARKINYAFVHKGSKLGPKPKLT